MNSVSLHAAYGQMQWVGGWLSKKANGCTLQAQERMKELQNRSTKENHCMPEPIHFAHELPAPCALATVLPTVT